MFHLGQIFVFWRLINKNALKWFLLVICEEHALRRSTNRLGETTPHCVFWLRREGQQMSNAEQHFQKQSLEVFFSKSCSQIFLNIHRKHLCWIPFLMKLSTFRPETLLERDSNIGVFRLQNFVRTPFLKNSSELNLGNNCLEICFWTVAFKTILAQLQKYQSLSNKSFKHNSTLIPSLCLIPTLSFWT